MASRTNALSELTRFWLQIRHGCLVAEVVPVHVPHGNSDIDLIAMRPSFQPWVLPDGTTVVRAIIEAKDEHDYDPNGVDMGHRLRHDMDAMGNSRFIGEESEARFTMLREQHFKVAQQLFGNGVEFHRLFVVHAINGVVLHEYGAALADRRIHFVTVRELVKDLVVWYGQVQNQPALRHTLMGDLWHLLVGYCGFHPAE